MKSVFLFSLILILFLSKGFAQVQDFRTWTSVSLEKSFSKKLKLDFEQMLRLSENSTQFSQTFTDCGVSYDLIKHLQVSANYRLTVRPDMIINRLYSSVSYTLKHNSWKAEPRLRIEHNFIPSQADVSDLRPKLTLSNKVSKRLVPYVSGELFFRIFYYEGDLLNQYRLSAGTDYYFDRKNSLQLYYVYEREVNVNAAQLNHIIGVGYNYKLK